MSTATAPQAGTQAAPVTSTIVASAALVKSASAFIGILTKADNAREELAIALSKEVGEKQLDRKGARTLLESAWIGALTTIGEKAGMKGTELTAYVQAELKRKDSERSRIVTLATTEHKDELEAGRKAGLNANEKLAIAQGKETVASIVEKKATGGTVNGTGGRPDGNKPAAPSTTPTPQAEAAAAKAAGLKPAEKYGNSVAALIALGRSLGLSLEAQMDIVTQMMAEAGAEAEQSAQA